MKVSELIAELAKLPADAETSLRYDGFCLITIGGVWLSQARGVILAGQDEPVYDEDTRTVGAVSQHKDQSLTVAEMLGLHTTSSEQA
jgi:hypothetical protein